jgi:hypothetical protein
MTTSHTQALTGLTANTLYHYCVNSRDASGNLTTSADQTFTTAAPLDTTPPVISGISSGSITNTGATISWTTNEAADTQVEYGTTASYGQSTTLNSTMATSHAQVLTGLTANTLYHYRVKSRDAAGNLAVSADQTFTTAVPPDTTPPVISGISSGSITNTGATISWTTNEAADTQVEYGTTTNYGTSTTLNSTMTTSHTQVLTGLTASMLYHYRVKSKDAAGNPAASSDQTFATAAPPTTAPVISNVSSGSITSTGATISWTTDETADTQVEYGTTTNYGTSTTLNSAKTMSHSQVLAGLTPSTLFHYRVQSKNASGNLSISADYSFITETVGNYEFAMPFFSSTQNTLGPNTMIGLDLANLGSGSTTAAFMIVDANGNALAGQDLTNPVMRMQASKNQISELDYQMFGNGLISAESDGWIKVNSTSADYKGFFMVFDSDHHFMDGAKFADTPLRDLVLPEIQSAGYNKISLINNNSGNANVIIDLKKADGSVRNSISRIINSNGTLVADLFNDLFVNGTADSTDYVRVRADQGVYGFSFLRQNSGDIAILEGQDSAGGGSALYLPQYMQSDAYHTSMSVINLDSTSGTVILRLIGDNGVQLGLDKTVAVPANGKVYIEDPEFFLDRDAGSTIAGYVEITSNGIRLSGSALFGDVNRQTFWSAMSMVSSLQTAVILNHVISNEDFSEQLTIVNPGTTDAAVTAALYSSSGIILDTNQVTVPAQGRLVSDLKECFTSLNNGDQSGGFVRLSSNNPMASFIQLSSSDSSVLAIVPPQAFQETTTIDEELQQQEVSTQSYVGSIVKYIQQAKEPQKSQKKSNVSRSQGNVMPVFKTRS